MGVCFADVKCRFGHKTRLFNMGRGHYVACDTCRSYLYVGSNLMSGWRQEHKDIWRQEHKDIWQQEHRDIWQQENFNNVKGYKFVR